MVASVETVAKNQNLQISKSKSNENQIGKATRNQA